MRLSLAIDAVGTKHSGGATVLTDVLTAAAADARFDRVSVFCSPRGHRTFDLPLSNKIREIECGFSESSRICRLWRSQFRLPSEVLKLGADVLLCMSGIGSAGQHIPHVTFVQQSLPFSPEALARISTFERLRMGVMWRAMKRSCTSSRQVIVQTPTMRRRVAEVFGIPSAQITVALPAVDDLPEPVEPSKRLAAMRETQPTLRLLYVGNQSAYKNVTFVIGAMRELRTGLPGLKIFLTWPADHPACRMEGVVGLGYLRGAELREAYELATVLVMPSLVETVGLPMLEAMNAGTPVVAADRPYAHDVCEDAAVFFDPLDVGDLTGKVLAVLGDERLRDQLVQRGQDVIRKRRSEKPYERMLDIVANAAAGRGQIELSR